VEVRVIVVGGGRVRVAYADGAAPGVDPLVGADGISLAVRRLLLPRGQAVAA
jgi:2-polyprenyl-6-methoxyphenol hydroxylase-like FAD-dependent oxidoreductase